MNSPANTRIRQTSAVEIIAIVSVKEIKIARRSRSKAERICARKRADTPPGLPNEPRCAKLKTFATTIPRAEESQTCRVARFRIVRLTGSPVLAPCRARARYGSTRLRGCQKMVLLRRRQPGVVHIIRDPLYDMCDEGLSTIIR